MDESTDDDVLAQHATTDVEAFAMLYRRHVQRVYSYTLSRVGNTHDAQDLTGQTFLAAMQALTSYEPRGMFSAWLLGIARRKAADHYRDNQQDLPIEDAELLSEPDDRIDDAVIERLQMEEIAALLGKLNIDRAEALRLRYFGELKLREIAQVMDKSEGAVKMLVARALDDLRKMLTLREETEPR
jgi:RNA polymerase sigma-70 factor (ECF subfamily)